ncbi:MAG: succinate dehydrogenase assembly factor 2 [Halothiobacillus sp.]|jgi:antitoxin CptB|nr:succinate dehydrogenase assembly factor 2 [Halothiobacillus sp.]
MVNNKNHDGFEVGGQAFFGAANLNRLRWRCRRGMLELDMVLACFLDERFAQLTEPQLREFERLLDLEDQELWLLIRDRASAASVVVQWLREGSVS